MKLSICITRYKENWETSHYLFESIAIQRGINFNDIEVIVSTDGDDKLDIPAFPYEIKQVYRKHKGVSANRNNALKNATGDYVMFCDIDDMFMTCTGLYQVFSAMQELPDVIMSHFIEEAFDEEHKYRLVRHETDATFIHGKVYRRKYLIDNEIYFDEDLIIHEDGFFNLIAQICTKDKKEIKAPFYMWKWNDNSTVRSYGEECVLKTYDHLMKCRIRICEELKKRGYEKDYQDAVAKTVIDSYYDFNKPIFLSLSNKEYRLKAEKAFKSFYTQFNEDYKKTPIKRIGELCFVCRTHAFNNGLRVEQVTLNQWLNHIMLEV